MAGAKALLHQLLQNQTQILARLDTVDKKLENLTAGQDQLSASQNQLSTELLETRKAQNDVALKVAAMRTHFHDPAGQRLVDTPELLEMILLELDECPDEEGEDEEYDDEIEDCYRKFGNSYNGRIRRQIIGLRTLLLARRVSKGFQATIDSSKKLQRALFFTPEPPRYASRRVNWLYLVTQVCHELYVERDEDHEARPQLALEGSEERKGWCHVMIDHEDTSILPGEPTLTLEAMPYMYPPRYCRCKSLEAYKTLDKYGDCSLRAASRSSSCMNMYLSQPPMKVCWTSSLSREKNPLKTLAKILPSHPTTISSLFSDA